MFKKNILRFTLATFVAFISAGCAKYPPGYVGLAATRVIFTMKVANKLNPDYVYVVGIRTSELDAPPDGLGPLPVMAPPWGNNGFLDGRCTHFVRWDKKLIPEYNLYEFTTEDLSNFRLIGAPVRYNQIDVNKKEDTLQFEIDLPQLTCGDVPAAMRIRTLLVNFITLNTTSRDATNRIWDAIGNTRDVNSLAAINVPVISSGTYDPRFYGINENTRDVSDPDLKITYFSVQVIRTNR